MAQYIFNFLKGKHKRQYSYFVQYRPCTLLRNYIERVGGPLQLLLPMLKHYIKKRVKNLKNK